MTFKLHYLKDGTRTTEEFDSLYAASDWAETHLKAAWCVVGPGDDDYLHFVYTFGLTRDLNVDLVETDEELGEVLDELLNG